MSLFSRRSLLCSALFVGLLPTTLLAADKPKEIRLDWATYNPVSMVLKEQGLLEKEFAKDGIAIRWVQTLGSNKALEFLSAGSIDFGSTAGSAALVSKINGNPIKSIYVYSRPEWTALVTRKDSTITKVSELKGKRVAVTRGTDPHIFLVRALLDAGLTEKDITPVLLQHPDGKTALIRGDVDAWAGLDPMMAQAEVEDGAKLFFRKPEANTWGILNVREEFLKDHPDLVRRVLDGLRGRAQAFARELRRREARVHRGDQAARGGGRQAAQGAHRADAFAHRRAAEGVDPGGRPRAAAGRRHQGRRRREGDGREPDRRPLGGGDELGLSVTSPACGSDRRRKRAGEGAFAAEDAPHPRRLPVERRGCHRVRGDDRASTYDIAICVPPMSLFSMTVEPIAATDEPRPLARFVRPALGLLLPVGLAIAWEIAVRAGVSDGRLVPPPSRIWATLVELAAAGELQRHVAVTVGARRGGLCVRRRGRHARRRDHRLFGADAAPARSDPAGAALDSRRSPGCRCSSCGSGFSNPRRSR